jgi:hypothetical protein
MFGRVCPVGMDIGSYFAVHFVEDSLELHPIPVIPLREISPKIPDGEIVSSAEFFELYLLMCPSPPCLPITA